MSRHVNVHERRAQEPGFPVTGLRTIRAPRARRVTPQEREDLLVAKGLERRIAYAVARGELRGLSRSDKSAYYKLEGTSAAEIDSKTQLRKALTKRAIRASFREKWPLGTKYSDDALNRWLDSEQYGGEAHGRAGDAGIAEEIRAAESRFKASMLGKTSAERKQVLASYATREEGERAVARYARLMQAREDEEFAARVLEDESRPWDEKVELVRAAVAPVTAREAVAQLLAEDEDWMTAPLPPIPAWTAAHGVPAVIPDMVSVIAAEAAARPEAPPRPGRNERLRAKSEMVVKHKNPGKKKRTAMKKARAEIVDRGTAVTGAPAFRAEAEPVASAPPLGGAGAAKSPVMTVYRRIIDELPSVPTTNPAVILGRRVAQPEPQLRPEEDVGEMEAIPPSAHCASPTRTAEARQEAHPPPTRWTARHSGRAYMDGYHYVYNGNGRPARFLGEIRGGAPVELQPPLPIPVDDMEVRHSWADCSVARRRFPRCVTCYTDAETIRDPWARKALAVDVKTSPMGARTWPETWAADRTEANGVFASMSAHGPQPEASTSSILHHATQKPPTPPPGPASAGTSSVLPELVAHYFLGRPLTKQAPRMDGGGVDPAAVSVAFRLATTQMLHDVAVTSESKEAATGEVLIGLNTRHPELSAEQKTNLAVRAVEIAAETKDYIHGRWWWSRMSERVRRFLWIFLTVFTVVAAIQHILIVYTSAGSGSTPNTHLDRQIISAICSVQCVLVLLSFVGWFRGFYARCCETAHYLRIPFVNAFVDSAGLLASEDLEQIGRGCWRLRSNRIRTMCLGKGDESKLGKHCKILRGRNCGACVAKPAMGAELMGWAAKPCYVLGKCLCNAHNALCHRHGTTQPAVKRDIREVFPDFKGIVDNLLATYLLHPMLDRQNWMEKWPLSKRRSIELSRMMDDIICNSVKTMVKREVAHKRPTKARLIQFYKNLLTQSEYGPQFYAAQKTILGAFDRRDMGHGIDITMASGMNSSSIGHWMQSVLDDGAKAFYERDGKNWDSSMQHSHAEFRCSLYDCLDLELGSFARQCVDVVGMAPFEGGVLKYKMKGTVKSGHNDTTLGNSLVNAAIAFASMRRLGIRGSIIVAGDDLLVATYDDFDISQFMSTEAEYGITPEARKFSDYRHVTFISGFWAKGAEMAFLPLPGRLVARLWWTISPPGKKRVAAYQRGVARGLLGVCGSLPVVGTWLRKFDSNGAAERVNKGCNFHEQKANFEGYGERIMAERYGVSVADIKDLDAWLQTLPAAPLMISHPVLDKMMNVDLADIAVRGEGVW